MKFNKKYLNLEEGLKKEWIITNGIGGYASSTIIGCNTRKYHGLLVAPLTPPARRFLIVSKIDEALEIEQKTYNLYTNMCRGYISDGYKKQEKFEKNYVPVFSYKVKDTLIDKTICMKYMENTVCILYKIKNGKYNSKLTLAPILNYRDFHQMNNDHVFNIKQDIKNRKIKVILDNNSQTPIYIYSNDGKYIKHEDDIFRNMYYIEEEKRGFLAEENHIVCGRFEVELKPNEEKEISIICSLEENIEEININKLIENETKRINELIDKSELTKNNDKELIKDYIIATDNFIVYRPFFGLHTLIAGYHWFLDWGRDAFISFEGTLLKTKRFEIAKQVLLTFTKNIKFGLVPNGYSGFDNRPLYNSVDASLLLFEQIKKYLNYTGDYEFIKNELYSILKNIIESYKNGIDLDNNNIYLDKDNLLVSGTPETQNTWMDAKYNDIAVTPRNGKAVEINSLWYNTLKIMEELAKEFETKEVANVYAKMANRTKKSFNEKFYNDKKKCLYDVLGDGKIRPNQLFSLSLTYPVIAPNSQVATEIFNTVTKKLLNKYGLKTLAKGESNYIEVYEGNGFKRDMSYHQGITWPWLLGIYYDAYKNMIKFEKDKQKKKYIEEECNKFIEKVKDVFVNAFYEDGMVGSISELYDSKAPYLPKGAMAQCWSVAEVFRIILK